MEKYVCIHGHFYQPPRENPWLEEIEFQKSAYPYHNWNERITAECYALNTASRILDKKGRIIEIVNNYSRISFNFGPTLLSWMERRKPEIYEAIRDADKLSQERFSGHGSAIAQVYNHMIMPLAGKRDKYTQVIWGIKDFEKRFGRFPEGMWLPETAVDIESLEILAELGISFTILAPSQASRVKKIKTDEDWQEVKDGSIDPTRAYLCSLPSGKTIALFFYNGSISRDVAFGDLLNSGETFAGRLLAAFSDHRDQPQLAHIATDGETYGHHHRFGDMALAYCLYFIEANNLAKITNYGEYLEKYPPACEVEILENSSWSCIHGIERWRDNCGCHSGAHPGWTQEWRKPLREAMDRLRDRLLSLWEKKTGKYLKDPWEARNDYIAIMLDRSRENIESFLEKHAAKYFSKEETRKVLRLLEMQRNAMLMFTSCGWFFDEISGIETTQVIQYAARVIQLAEKLWGISVEPEFLAILEKAASNIPESANGAKIYELSVKPAMLDLMRVAAHFAISSLFEEYPEIAGIYCYTVKNEAYDLIEAGRLRLVVGKVTIRSDITWSEEAICFAVLHLGDHNLNGGVRNFINDEAFSIMKKEIGETFNKGDVPQVIRLMDKHFGANNYSLWHLFRDEKRKVLHQVLRPILDEVELSFRQAYENNYPTMNFLHEVKIPLPKSLLAASEFVINKDMEEVLKEEKPDLEKLEQLIGEVRKWDVNIDKPTLSFVASSAISSLTENLAGNREKLSLMEEIEHTIRLLRSLPLDLDLWRSQNIYFDIGQSFYEKAKARAEKGEKEAVKWLEVFRKLGDQLQVKVS